MILYRRRKAAIDHSFNFPKFASHPRAMNKSTRRDVSARFFSIDHLRDCTVNNMENRSEIGTVWEK
jgi:hypothetical protein